MSERLPDKIDLEFIARLLRSIQAEQRTLRDENRVVRRDLDRISTDLARFATRDESAEVSRVVADRIGSFEATMDTRFDRMLGQVAGLLAEEIAKHKGR